MIHKQAEANAVRSPIPKKADDVPVFPGILENRSSSLEFLFFVAANVRNELARQRAVVKIGTARIGSKQRIEIKARVRHRRARTQFVGVERFEKCRIVEGDTAAGVCQQGILIKCDDRAFEPLLGRRDEPVCDTCTQVGRRTPGDSNGSGRVEVVVALEDVRRIPDRIN